MKSCVEWLREYLQERPRHNKGVRRAAKAAGYSREQVREAKGVLGVRATPISDRGQRTSAIFWKLPEDRDA
jgi:hypothetical protein